MHRLLNSDASVQDITPEWLAAADIVRTGSLSSAPDTEESVAYDHRPDNRRTLVVEFESTGDGRGFSLAASYRERYGQGLLLFACGALIPDQISLAFQCGFDGIVITPGQWALYGEAAWLGALSPVVDCGYSQGNWHSIESIWGQRQALAS